jgi:cellulose synthase/poly-beta-1,6-N-acetylglucosamine synthase-like glycosyltransferase
MIFQIAQIVFLTIFGCLTLYLALLSIFALFARIGVIGSKTTLNRFAIVVPAHNEETSIEETLRSILEIEYPRPNYDVIVIADNCTDRTAEIARELGAKVFERTNPDQRGKGYALRWCFDIILGPEYSFDAIAVIDADSTASRNFLKVLNQYLHRGSQAIQVSDMVKPQPGNWSSEITRLGFTLYNHVRPLGRKVIRCSAGIRGNGMCFSSKTLRDIPWNTYSLNEDLEYGLLLLLKGVSVDFAPETNVIATMPNQASNAVSQRSRWEKGRFPIIKKYSMKLLLGAFSKFSYRLFDAFIELVTPAFVNLFAFALLMFCLTGLFLIIGIYSSKIFLILWGIVLSLGIIHVIVGLFVAGADRELLKAFFYIPKYVFWKLMVYSRIISRQPQNEWIRTTREKIK